MSDASKPSSSAPPPPPPTGAISIAAPPPDAPPAEWQWGLSVPPALLASMAQGLTELTSRPVLPTASNVHVEGPGRRETMWNPLEGDPLGMAALGASGAVPGGMSWPPPAAPARGNGMTDKRRVDATRQRNATAPAPVESIATASTPPGARLRPVTGRRQREPLPATINITAGSYRSNLAPPPGGAIGSGATSSAMTAPGVMRESAPGRRWTRRSRLLVALLVALLLCAGAAGAIFVTVPPLAVIHASIGFEREAGPIGNEALRDFHQAQEALLWSKAVRDTAAESLAKGQTSAGAGFLANLHQLTRSARVRWDANADATRDELTLEYATTDPGADADRLTALFRALYDAATTNGSSSRADALKLQLLESEVHDYTRELEYLGRRLQTLREELRIARLGAPQEGEIDALNSDVSRLSAAYQNALAARIRAEVASGVAPQPATMPGTDGVLPPPDAAPVNPGQHRKLEHDTLVELRTKEKHLAEAVAQQETIEQKEREMNGVTDTIGSLTRSLEEKRKELAAASESRPPVFTPLAPSPARVVEEHDSRPLWIGVAVAAVCLCFAGYVAIASRGYGEA